MTSNIIEILKYCNTDYQKQGTIQQGDYTMVLNMHNMSNQLSTVFKPSTFSFLFLSTAMHIIASYLTYVYLIIGVCNTKTSPTFTLCLALSSY